ncbi:hypothetical protein C5470_04030 [Photorhabdus stackebrandtii]|uniref:Uncharacterized protein n=2 Tax=Photorhabdus stackebrandtii TaxID=1123042 RepID=A0A7X5TKG5_9GAMM|nr:hypothetical protein [Photorhabdus stackebrandtii]
MYSKNNLVSDMNQFIRPIVIATVILSLPPVAALLLTGQGIKVLIKNTTKDPCPYVVWLEKKLSGANR